MGRPHFGIRSLVRTFYGRMEGLKAKRVRLILRPGVSQARVSALVRWIRVLAPAAALVLATPGTLLEESDGASEDTLSIDAETVASGPLSLATLLFRATKTP